jgi:hypothetical protein
LRLRYFLEDIFGQKSKIKILRVFLKTKMALTGRQVAELAALNHRTCQLALADLEEQALIKARQVGRASLFELNEANRFVTTNLFRFFQEEENLLKNFTLEVLADAKSQIDSLILFGELVQGREKEDSEVNFLVVSSASKDKLEKIFQPVGAAFFTSFGKITNVYLTSKRELLEKIRRSEPLFREAVKTGRVLFGQNISEILSHGHREK